MYALQVNTSSIPLSLRYERAEGREGDDQGETKECNGVDGGKGMCARMWGHSNEGL